MRGHQEWSQRCRFNDPNCGGSPLRREEEHEGSIVLYVYQNGGNENLDPSFNGFLLDEGGLSATKTARR